MRKLPIAFFLLLFFSGIKSIAQMPKLINENGHHTLLVDGKPFFILGGQVHNSSA